MPKILVIDDSLFARLNICDILKEGGHETVEAENGNEGLKKVIDENPDCALTDLLMPEMDGIAFLKVLREKGLNLPVIVLSADIQETKRKQCLELGAAGFISKPLQKDEILGMIARILNHKGA
jgi:CheY-like chemotaxis protein